MISDSGNLPFIHYEPVSSPCAYCAEECIGTIGFMDDMTKSAHCCPFCYEHVVHLRPLLFEWSDDYIFSQIVCLKKLEQTPRVILAIEKYKERI